ncbi:hypothetical protein DFP73DRAFT_635923 [Morchella snyderi]|nr:hypothetical protein DFP73DRAFT_635923 [Morchella snyderi]
MPPNSELRPGDMWLIDKIKVHLSNIQGAQLRAGEQKSFLLQHAAKVEAAAAKLVESAPVETVRKRLCWDADAESLVWGVEAETARLEAELEKVRKEVETAQAWAESKWAETERVEKKLESFIEGALRGLREEARVRVETERVHKVGGKTTAETKKTSEEEEGSKDYARIKQETRDTVLELKTMSDEGAKMQYEAFRPVVETDRLALEAERLRAEVELVVWMTVADWQKVARD